MRSRPPWDRAGDRQDGAALSIPPSPQGFCWMHVGTDQPFTSVSIGTCYQVWAVARDGSAFYRSSVSPSRPNGENPRLRRSPCARRRRRRRRHVGSSARGGYGYFRFQRKPVDGAPFNQRAFTRHGARLGYPQSPHPLCWDDPGVVTP